MTADLGPGVDPVALLASLLGHLSEPTRALLAHGPDPAPQSDSRPAARPETPEEPLEGLR
jgi:hypothetical protein